MCKAYVVFNICKVLKNLLGKLFTLPIIGYQINTYLSNEKPIFPLLCWTRSNSRNDDMGCLILNFVNEVKITLIFWVQIIFFMDKTLEET